MTTKQHSENDLQVLDDAVAWARKVPHMLFPSREPSVFGVLAWLMADVLAIGRGTCVIRQGARWSCVGSDVDWLRHEKHSVSELFNRVVAEPGNGRNAMRGEIVVRAYANSVWTSLDARRRRISGKKAPETAWKLAAGLHRAVLFSM